MPWRRLSMISVFVFVGMMWNSLQARKETNADTMSIHGTLHNTFIKSIEWQTNISLIYQSILVMKTKIVVGTISFQILNLSLENQHRTTAWFILSTVLVSTKSSFHNWLNCFLIDQSWLGIRSVFRIKRLYNWCSTLKSIYNNYSLSFVVQLAPY
jgi:hypothetical protein